MDRLHAIPSWELVTTYIYPNGGGGGGAKGGDDTVRRHRPPLGAVTLLIIHLSISSTCCTRPADRPRFSFFCRMEFCYPQNWNSRSSRRTVERLTPQIAIVPGCLTDLTFDDQQHPSSIIVEASVTWNNKLLEMRGKQRGVSSSVDRAVGRRWISGSEYLASQPTNLRAPLSAPRWRFATDSNFCFGRPLNAADTTKSHKQKIRQTNRVARTKAPQT